MDSTSISLKYFKLHNLIYHFPEQIANRAIYLYSNRFVFEQEGLLTPTAQRSACETSDAHPSCWSRCLQAQILRERGHPLPKC